MNLKTDIKCPFCGGADFDLIGLKIHLICWCDVYDKTPLVDYCSCSTAIVKNGRCVNCGLPHKLTKAEAV